MANDIPKTRFWTVLAIINVVAMAYPLNLYLEAAANDNFFPAILLASVAFLLMITDAVSALVVHIEREL